MRNTIFAAALAGTALSLSACAEAPEETTTAEETAAPDNAEEATVSADAVLDPNTATAEELAVIDGMTPELAEAIVAGRPYDSAMAFNTKLMETLDEGAAATVRERVFVPINLNSASEDEIKLVPGMTDKMVHEFEEYRPYENMEEFDREIGKYVDEAEVARFRKYVTL